MKISKGNDVQLVKKPPKLNEKTRRKTGSSIDEKPPKLHEEMKKKTDYLYVALLEMKNLQNLAKKIGRKN